MANKKKKNQKATLTLLKGVLLEELNTAKNAINKNRSSNKCPTEKKDSSSVCGKNILRLKKIGVSRQCITHSPDPMMPM